MRQIIVSSVSLINKSYQLKKNIHSQRISNSSLDLDKPPVGKGLISYDDLPEPVPPPVANPVSFTIKRKATPEERLVKKRALTAHSDFLVAESSESAENKVRILSSLKSMLIFNICNSNFQGCGH